MTKRIRIAVLGASGYTGADLVRLALTHPNIEIAHLAASARAGQAMADVWPHFAPYPALPVLEKAEDIDFSRLDLMFGCLPHAASAALIAGIDCPHVIDLSADFRLKDADIYADWYATAHPAPDMLIGAVYGLTEFARESLKAAKLVACPGCYPTATLLALLPLVPGIAPDGIIINALSGVSGAGRAVKEANLFTEIGESAGAYAVGRHRHMPEIEQELGFAFGRPVTVSFTPHLVPMSRGELVTISVALRPGETHGSLRARLLDRYADEAFVHLLPEGVAPATRMVRGSNHAVVNVFPDRIAGRVLVIAAIDNLVKGSSGQAIQNMNRMFGLPETRGLEAPALFP